ncbi:MAG: CapA family protein [Patescibacteria group bacterium]
MVRYFYFAILIGILGGLSFAFFNINSRIVNLSSTAVSSSLQANLIATQFQVISRIIDFKKQEPITLIFVGDIMLDRGVANQIKKNSDYYFPFLKTAEILRSADLTFGNLEGPISSSGRNQGSIYSFRAEPSVVEGLRFAGFDVLSVANNHIMDWGREALEDTVDILEANGIKSIGAGKNFFEANNFTIKEIKGTKVAFFAFTDLYPKSLEADVNSAGISSFDAERVKNEIWLIKNLKVADIVVVSFHWGKEYETRSNSFQQKIGRDLINSGADIIIGHHPHVVQEIERYKSGWIAYSLGNFVFDQNFSDGTKEGLALFAEIRDKKIISFNPLEIKINPYFQPEIVSNHQ